MQFFTALLIPNVSSARWVGPLPSAGRHCRAAVQYVQHIFFTRLALRACPQSLLTTFPCTSRRLLRGPCHSGRTAASLKSAVASGSTGKSSCTPGIIWDIFSGSWRRQVEGCQGSSRLPLSKLFFGLYKDQHFRSLQGTHHVAQNSAPQFLRLQSE